jgi:hypothetical protein
MGYLRRSSAPQPNQDLPDDIKSIYTQAASELPDSPRSSAALLRLCLKHLRRHFEQPGKDINRRW